MTDQVQEHPSQQQPQPLIKHRKPETDQRVQIGGLYLDRDVFEWATIEGSHMRGGRSAWIRRACRLVMEAEKEQRNEERGVRGK